VSIPSYAPAGKHRLHLTYSNDRLRVKLDQDLYFDVANDGSWAKDALVDGWKAKYPAVAILQQGVPCRELGVEKYAGAQDTYIYSTHSVPDRNSDHINYGGLGYLQVGRYALASRPLVRFDLSKVPADAALAEAALQIYLYGRSDRRGGSPGLVAYPVLKDWGAGRGLGDLYAKNPILPGEASWLCNRHPEKWAKAGCGEAGVDRAEQPGGQGDFIKEPKGWVTIRLDKALIVGWLKDPASNKGLILQDRKEEDGSCCQYRSSEYEDEAFRPRLILAFGEELPGK
jgi:hypothetical protein